MLYKHKQTPHLIVMRYAIIRIYLIALLVVLSNIAGCTIKYIDTVTIFEIKGEVYDNDSRMPIENAAVRFMDTGYDYVRSSKPFPVTIGYSQANGKFSARLNYLWRSKDTTLQNPPQKTFEVILTHEDYEPRRFHFNENNLEQDGMRFEINLEKVYMLPKKRGENSGN